MNSNRAPKFSTMIYIINHQFISIQQTVLSKKYYHLQKFQFYFYNFFVIYYMVYKISILTYFKNLSVKWKNNDSKNFHV